jgi:hypothetical protein
MKPRAGCRSDNALILEVADSILGQDTGYPELGVSWF